MDALEARVFCSVQFLSHRPVASLLDISIRFQSSYGQDIPSLFNAAPY